MSTWLIVTLAAVLVVFSTVAIFGLAMTAAMFIAPARRAPAPAEPLELELDAKIGAADLPSGRPSASATELARAREASRLARGSPRDALDGFAARNGTDAPCRPCAALRRFLRH